MAGQYPYILEACDVRRADQPETSRARIIDTMALPALTRKTTDHTAGGGVGTINYSWPQIDAPEPKFGTAGFDLDVLKKYGLAAGTNDRWVFAGSVRVPKKGELALRAIIEGVINSWEPDEFSVGNLLKCNHTIVEVTHYELTIDREEMFYWDADENEARSGGVSWFAGTRRALGI